MDDEQQNAFQAVTQAVKQIQERMQRSWLGKSVEWLGENFGATWRQGTGEIAQILPAFPDSVRPVETLGTMNNPTQLQINQEIGAVGDTGSVYGKEFQRDPGYEEWLDSRAGAGRQPPSDDLGRER